MLLPVEVADGDDQYRSYGQRAEKREQTGQASCTFCLFEGATTAQGSVCPHFRSSDMLKSMLNNLVKHDTVKTTFYKARALRMMGDYFVREVCGADCVLQSPCGTFLSSRATKSDMRHPSIELVAVQMLIDKDITMMN